MSTTSKFTRIQRRTGRPEEVTSENRNQFTSVVTLTPMSSIGTEIFFCNRTPENGSKITADDMNTLFPANVRWHNVGGMAEDDGRQESWEVIAYYCTHLDDAHKVYNDPNYKPVRKDIADQINAEDVRTWFEPVFQTLDEAVFGNGKALVHCSAGKSRSASVIAAYLINRFDVTAEEAVRFVCQQRACAILAFAKVIPPETESALKKYELDLKAARRR